VIPLKKSLIIAILCLALFLSGCGNYRDLNEFDLVAGMAIDEAEEGYQVTLELIDLGGSMQEGVKSYTVSLEGATVPQALQQAKTMLSRQFHYGNMEVIVISQALAQQGIASLLDGFLRNVDIRETIQLAISLDDTASEIFAAKGRDLSVASYALSKMITQSNNTQFQPREVSIFNALDALHTPGKSLMLPAVGSKQEEEQEDAYIQLEGLAVFVEGNLRYTLPEGYVPIYLLVKDRLASHDLTFQLPGSDENSTIHITQSKTQRSFEEGEDQIIFRLDVRAKGQLGQSVVGTDLENPDQKAALEQAASQALGQQIQELLNYQLHNGDTNPADWLYDVYLQDDSLWESIQSKSKEARPEVSMDVRVTMEILDSGIVRGI
jgi:spore germination protein KC